MYQILGNLPFVKIYLDDITIHSQSFDKHLEHIKEVCKRLAKANLKINLKKCEWSAKEIKLLGHIISKNNVLMDPSKISALKDRKPPKNVKDIQIFLGICGYYRRFIKNYADMTVPLNKLLQGEQKWEWGEEQTKAFEDLKKALISYPILRMPDFNKPFIIYTDASGYAIGAVLSQKTDSGEESAVCYASRTLKGAEINYGITEKECLAVVWAIKQYRVYVHGKKFSVITDHAALAWLMNITDPTGRLARWSIYLQAYTFDIVHRKGLLHSNADTLSRPPRTESLNIAMLNYVNVMAVKIDPLEDEPLMFYLENGKYKAGTSRKTINRVNRLLPHYKWNDNKLMFRKNIQNDKYLEIPRKNVRNDIILKAHLLGHFQTESTMNRIKEKYIWKGLEKDTIAVISQCKECMEHHGIRHQEHPAQSTKINYVHERIGIDLVNGFPETDEGYNGILVITEYLTKFIMVYPIKSKQAIEIAEKLLDYIGLFGPPQIILSDQGTEFNNTIVKRMLDSVGIEHRITSAYHPRTNGQAERVNQVFVESLKKYTTNDNTKWHKWIPFVSLAYRSRVHSSTGYTPFELMFGRKMMRFEEWRDDRYGDGEVSIHERVKEIRDLVEGDYIKAKDNIESAQAHQRKAQNRRANLKEEKLAIGTTVYVAVKGIKEKLGSDYKGPFTIIDYTKNGNYILANSLGERMDDTYPLERLKKVPTPVEEAETYEVERILDHYGPAGNEKYLVKWKNYPHSENTWERASNFNDKKTIRNYWKKKGTGPKRCTHFSKNLLTILIFFLLLPLTVGGHINMTDRIYVCDTIQEANTPFLDTNGCRQDKLYKDIPLETSFNNMAVLSKDSYEVYGQGFECHKQSVLVDT